MSIIAGALLLLRRRVVNLKRNTIADVGSASIDRADYLFDFRSRITSAMRESIVMRQKADGKCAIIGTRRCNKF